MQNGKHENGQDDGDVVAAGDEACVEKSLDELVEVFEFIWGNQVKGVATLFTLIHNIPDCQC